MLGSRSDDAEEPQPDSCIGSVRERPSAFALLRLISTTLCEQPSWKIGKFGCAGFLRAIAGSYLPKGKLDPAAHSLWCELVINRTPEVVGY